MRIYSFFVSRVGRAAASSSEITRGIEGREGDSLMMEGVQRGNNIVDSSTDESSMFDETTLNEVSVKSEKVENEQTLLADKTTPVIPPEEIQGFLREKGINSRRPRKGIKVKKDDKGQFLCPVCNHPFNQRERAVHHSYTHMNQLELGKINIYHQRCPHSPQRIFFTRQNYARHINSHLGIKNFKCEICHKDFGRKEHLQNHMLIHVNQGSHEVPTPIRHIPCYFCHRKFGGMSFLIRHLSIHTKETPFKCSYCNTWFTQTSHMTSHARRIHSHPDNPEPFPCPQCAKSFYTKQHLDKHVDGVHRKIRHQCPHCQKSYSTKSYMLKHIKGEHSGD